MSSKEATPTKECTVCLEDTKQNVECPSCDYSCCLGCTKTYLLGQTATPHCMSCKTGWSNQDQHRILPSGWLEGTGKNGYRTRRKALLLEKEKSRAKVYAEHVDLVVLPRRRALKADHLTRAAHGRHSAGFYAINAEISEVNALMAMTGVPAELNALKAKKKEITARKTDIAEKLEGELRLQELQEEKPVACRPSILCGCPVPTCQGMVKFPGECITCEVSVCAQCCELREEGHVCDPGVLQSTKKIREMTKACPNSACGERIEKVDGCDQMWCTKCQTAFSWTTRKIIHSTTVLHNPHYHEWLNQNGNAVRGDRDVPCGGFDGRFWMTEENAEIETHLLVNMPKRYLVGAEKKDEQEDEEEDSLEFCLMHLIRDTDIILTNTEYDLADKLLEAGVRHTLGEIDEKAWCNSIFRATREAEKRGAIRQVILAMRNVSIEHYNEVYKARGCDLRVFGRSGRRSEGERHENTAHIGAAKDSLGELLGIVDLFDGFLGEETRPYKMKDPPRVICDSKGHLSWSGTYTRG